MAVDCGFGVAGEIRVERGEGTVFFGQAQRFRKQPAGGPPR
jgi:hypothetical protein